MKIQVLIPLLSKDAYYLHLVHQPYAYQIAVILVLRVGSFGVLLGFSMHFALVLCLAGGLRNCFHIKPGKQGFKAPLLEDQSAPTFVGAVV